MEREHATWSRETRAVGERDEAVQPFHRSSDRNSPRWCEGEMPLDEEGRYVILFSGRQDGQNVEGVGIALSPQARAAMRHHQSVSPRIMTAEFLTQVGPLMIVLCIAQ